LKKKKEQDKIQHGILIKQITRKFFGNFNKTLLFSFVISNVAFAVSASYRIK
jgi:hypothetical protein